MARLGTVIHRLLEEAAQGAFSSKVEPSRPQARWNELVDEAERTMSERSLEKQFVPLKENVAKFDVLRIRTLARVSELTAGVPSGDARAAKEPQNIYGPEVLVRSADDLIIGKIDRAVPAPGGPVLQDYKSGSIFSLEQGAEQELKPEYTLQLRLYAALYYETNGQWPSQLQLVPLSGEAQDVSFTPSECMSLLDDAREILTRVNEEIAQFRDDWDSLEMRLASPSPSACRFCAYRPACIRYLSRELSEEDLLWPTDVWGSLTELRRLGNGRLMLKIELRDDSILFVRGITDPAIEQAMLDTASRDVPVGVFNARKTQSPRAFEAGALTSVVSGRISSSA